VTHGAAGARVSPATASYGSRGHTRDQSDHVAPTITSGWALCVRVGKERRQKKGGEGLVGERGAHVHDLLRSRLRLAHGEGG
jgi:hypothetical protein